MKNKKHTQRLIYLAERADTIEDCVKLRKQCLSENRQIKKHLTYIKLQLYILRTLKERHGKTDAEIVEILTAKWNAELMRLSQVREALVTAIQTVEQNGTKAAHMGGQPTVVLG